MEIKIFNSLSNQLEVFKPLEEGKVSMYVCGPTVYGYVHVGNLRPVITFDILRRLFERVGYDVTYISNITDIDDKIINTAIKENTTEEFIANLYEENFFKVTDAVNAKKPTHVPHATKTIDRMVDFIQKLIDLGYAYEKDGDVFFRVTKVKDYGQLGHFEIENLQSGARIEENSKKENPLDFALWKKTEIGIKFPAPFGEGRPGWHTECVVMIQEYYPEGRIDIHGGGFDLKFPHHENEIAQAEACFHHNIATYWMHNGFINIDNVKMSKSIGNVRLAKDLVSEYGGNVIRMVMLSSHYRAPLNFSDEVLKNAANDVEKIMNVLKQANIQLDLEGKLKNVELDQVRIEAFLNELAVDLNTSNALTVLYSVVKDLNMAIRRKEPTMGILYHTIKDMIDVLGLKYDELTLKEEEKALFNKWYEYRANKDFANADIIRNQLVELKLL